MTFRDAWWAFVGDVAVVSVVAVPVALIVGAMVWWHRPQYDYWFAGVFTGAIVYVLAIFVAMFGTQSW